MSKRLEVIREKFEEALVAAIKGREGKVVVDPVERFASFDPSRNKSATQWLVATYLNEGFLLEDLSKAYETLLVFSQVKRLLPVDQRSLNKYKTLAGMWKTIEGAGLLNSSPYWTEKTGGNRENLSSNEEKKASKEKAYEESILVYQDEDFEVVVPLTEFAAKWHGKGTRWCTSADKNNYFHRYNKDAPLIITREKRENGSINKSQLWVTKDSVQFMDASDEEIERLEEGDVRIPILKWACGINGRAIMHLPEEHLDKEMCLIAVQHGLALKYVPNELKSYKMCLAAVQQDGWVLEYVPEEFRNYEMCMAAVQQDGRALQYVPEEFKTQELCMAAVKQNGWAIEFVPDKFKTKELCMAAVSQCGWALTYVPEEFRDRKNESFPNYEMCMVAVKQNGLALRYAHQKLYDYELCLAAVKTNGWVLEYVPKELCDKEIYMAAVQQAGNALQFVPREFRSRELCLAAVMQDGMALIYVPKEFKDEEDKAFFLEICLAAVKQNKEAIEYVVDEFQYLFQDVHKWKKEMLSLLTELIKKSNLSSENKMACLENAAMG